MLYVIGSLCIPMKQAYGKEVIQSELKSIKGLINQDPAISKLDLLAVKASDVGGLKKKDFAAVIANKHPEVLIVYLYNKKNERLDNDSLIEIEIPSKLNMQVLKDILDPVLQQLVLQERNVSRHQNETLGNSDNSTFESEPTGTSDVEQYDEIPELKFEPFLDLDDLKQSDFLPELEPIVSNEPIISKKLEPIPQETTLDPQVLRDLLNSDNISKRLMMENATFQGAINLMQVYDMEMQAILQDTSLSRQERISKIRTASLQKATQVDIKNNYITERMLEIINRVISMVGAETENQVAELNSLLKTFETTDRFYQNNLEVNKQMQLRLKKRTEIATLLNSIYVLYSVMDEETSKFIARLSEGLPSSNAYINTMLSGLSKIILPPHMGEIINRINRDLSSGRDEFSILESKIQRLQELVLDYNKVNEAVITEQEKIARMLKANKVEEIIIVNSALKSSLRAYIGTNDIGKTATFVTHSGCQSRVRNTLMLNFCSDVNLETYGVFMMDAEDFFSTKVVKPLLGIDINLHNNVDNLREIIKKLIFKLDYYHHVNLLFDDSQLHLVEAIADELLSITFITNSTTRSLKITKDLYSKWKAQNVAQKVVIIDPPEELTAALEYMDIDQLLTKLIVIPHLTRMRYFAMRNFRPWEDGDIAIIFDTAFN